MTEKEKARKLTHREVFILGQIIEAHCQCVEGWAVYGEGWSDTEVLKTLDHQRGFTLRHVSRLRKALFGDLRPAALPTSPPADTNARLTVLEAHTDHHHKLMVQLLSWASERPVNPFPTWDNSRK